jgi:acyl-CoA oxidase
MSSFSPPAPSFSTETLSEIFDHDNHAKRREFRKMVRDDLFSLREGLSVEDERKLAHERLKAYCQRGAISIFDFEKNPLNLTNGEYLLRSLA